MINNPIPPHEEGDQDVEIFQKLEVIKADLHHWLSHKRWAGEDHLHARMLIEDLQKILYRQAHQLESEADLNRVAEIWPLTMKKQVSTKERVQDFLGL